MSIHLLLRCVLFFWIAGSVSVQQGTACSCEVDSGQPLHSDDSRPNIIVIVTDDQGYADVGFNGLKDFQTPSIDRIAHEGVRCTNAYVSFSVCSPSRAGLMTGRYQGRFGYTTNPTIDPSNPNAGIPLSETMMPETLQKAGYTTMAIGKWHLGTHVTLRPNRRGFDHFFGFLSGGHHYFPKKLTIDRLEDVPKTYQWYSTRLLENETPVTIDKYLTDALSDRAVQFVDEAKDKPFFLYLAYNAPHTPMQATKEYLDRVKHIEKPKRQKYAAMMLAVDDGIGRLLAKLEEKELDEKTIIFFLSDNGGATTNASDNTPLRGRKGSLFEGGLRVPFAVRWKGVIPEGRDFDPAISTLDIFSTVLALADAPAPEKELDGVNLLPHLTGKKTGDPHPVLMWRHLKKKAWAIRQGDYKLILNAEQESWQLLFNLKEDIG